MVVSAIEESLRRLDLTGQSIVIAASGGVDSTVLLHALSSLADSWQLQLAVGHIDHGLRGSESDGDRRAVEELADRLGLRCLVEAVDPGSLRTGRSNRERPTLQEAARELRYAALERMSRACGARHIATAHNLDDQAETVLMRLFRGTGPSGLGGIPERSRDGRVVRPLLSVSRAEIEAFALERGIVWREDSSNASDGYTRNRLRRHWIPELAREFNPRLLRAIGGLAEAQRTDNEWIDSLLDNVEARWISVRPEGVELVKEGWGELPDALARRLTRRALIALGGGRDMSRVHLERMLAFIRTEPATGHGRAIELPGGLLLSRQPTRFILSRTRV
jgi:tRNA(Ile)-lysidine synthase